MYQDKHIPFLMLWKVKIKQSTHRTLWMRTLASIIFKCVKIMLFRCGSSVYKVHFDDWIKCWKLYNFLELTYSSAYIKDKITLQSITHTKWINKRHTHCNMFHKNCSVIKKAFPSAKWYNCAVGIPALPHWIVNFIGGSYIALQRRHKCLGILVCVNPPLRNFAAGVTAYIYICIYLCTVKGVCL